MNGNVEQRATRRIAIALGVTTLSALGLAVVYLTGGQSQLEGIALALALGGLGLLWIRRRERRVRRVRHRPHATPTPQGMSMAKSCLMGRTLLPRSTVTSFLARRTTRRPR